MLDNPEVMEKSIEEAQKALKDMGGLSGMQEKMQEVMSGLADLKPEDLQGMLGGLGGDANEDLLSAMGGGGDDALQGRVREQLARMLRNQGGGDDGEPAVELDEF